MKIKKILLVLVLLMMSKSTFAQVVLDSTYTGFIKNKAGLNGYLSRTISKTVMDTVTVVSFNEMELNRQLTVVGFELTIVKSGHKPVTFINGTDGQLSDAMKAALKNVTPGNKIYIEKIKAATKEHKVYSLFAASYTVE